MRARWSHSWLVTSHHFITPSVRQRGQKQRSRHSAVSSWLSATAVLGDQDPPFVPASSDSPQWAVGRGFCSGYRSVQWPHVVLLRQLCDPGVDGD
ncbi:hypothetical protein OEZ85_007479 [Tetradesmus obliquus]|uniref:Secreted protein n=1 Tax=Tetradesmus obliquus TaxID=3088 RepID=A0ABY8TG10_TETOB|nr:hypothetical protein OEZ85_007479 [Tetradesmus obliquus]